MAGIKLNLSLIFNRIIRHNKPVPLPPPDPPPSVKEFLVKIKLVGPSFVT